MLNLISTSLVAYLLRRVAVREHGQQQPRHQADPRGQPDPRLPDRGRPGQELYGFLVIAVLTGVLYWFVLNRTRFGFDLRATGAVRRPRPSPAASA